MIKIIKSAKEMSQISERVRKSGKTVALVPTMGALHRGHLALVEEAKQRADFVIVTIFVNPTQFAPNEDLDEYPRTLEKDEIALRGLGGVDCIFHPNVGEIYDTNHSIWIEASGLDKELCGEFRPGHFRGVCTVVYKLFTICLPHVAIFGKKDAQQFVIIKALSRDLLMGVEIIGTETVREEDGLALSSRNRYLSEKHRQSAPVIRKAILQAKEAILQGEQRIEAIVGNSRKTIESVGDAEIQYFKIVDSTTLQALELLESGSNILLATAVYFGDTRLIDNAFIDVP